MGLTCQIIWLDSIDSTNSEARRRISELDNLAVIAADCQTEGRGQGDHKWHSLPGENLTFTVVVKYGNLAELKASNAVVINDMVTGALLGLLARHGIQARVKLPNDIYVGDKKICGILIENILKGEFIDTGIIGIGLDVNQTEFPEDLPNPISMAILTGKKFDLQTILEQFLEEFGAQLQDHLF